MIVVVRRIGVPTLVALAMGAGTGRAQETFDINIVNNGKPIADVEVILLANDGKTTVGTTAVDGSVTVDMNLANVGKGTRVDVYEIECDDQVVVVLVAQGEQQAFEEECERRRAENNACECRRIGFFIWGDGNVTIDVGTNQVTPPPFEETATTDLKAEYRWRFGVGVDARHFYDFKDVSDQPDALQHDATTWSPGFQAFAEFMLLRYLLLGAEGSFAKLETETTFAEGVQRGDIDYLEVGGYGRIPLTRNPFVNAYVLLTALYAWNKADFTLGAETADRDHGSWRGGLGGGVEFYVTPFLAIRVDGLYNTNLQDGDADEHIRWKLAMMFGKLFTLVNGIRTLP